MGDIRKQRCEGARGVKRIPSARKPSVASPHLRYAGRNNGDINVTVGDDEALRRVDTVRPVVKGMTDCGEYLGRPCRVRG